LTPAILVVLYSADNESRAPRFFLKVQQMVYLSEVYVFLKHAVHFVQITLNKEGKKTSYMLPTLVKHYIKQVR
jgi:hypothetical protein